MVCRLKRYMLSLLPGQVLLTYKKGFILIVSIKDVKIRKK